MVMLDTQYRMHEAICTLISGRMYAGRLQTTRDADWLHQRARMKRPPPPFDGALTLIDTSELNCAEGFEDGSRFNLTHALLVRNLCFYFAQSGFVSDPKALGVCTPYAPQVRLVHKLLKEHSLEAVQVGSVHTFQGDERDAIILDFPDSQGAKAGRFLQGVAPSENSSRLINVAISRARNHLIVIANLQHLDRTLPSKSILRGVLCGFQSTGHVLPAADLFAIGPLGRDFEGLDPQFLDDTARQSATPKLSSDEIHTRGPTPLSALPELFRSGPQTQTSLHHQRPAVSLRTAQKRSVSPHTPSQTTRTARPLLPDPEENRSASAHPIQRPRSRAIHRPHTP
jgi:AAA domain-containing protein